METRGLEVFRFDGEGDYPNKWRWGKLREYDIPFFASNCRPEPVKGEPVVAGDKSGQQVRVAEYQRLRGNMPVVDVLTLATPGSSI